MAVTVYRSDDASAPTLDGTSGSICGILKACLVDGYGTKPGAGWTVPYDDTPTKTMAFRQGARSDGFGKRCFLTVSGDGLTGRARVWGRVGGYSATYTDGCFPSKGNVYMTRDIDQTTTEPPVFFHSSTGDATVRPWVVIADERTFSLVVFPVSSGSSVGNSIDGMFYYFGDVESQESNDTPVILVATHPKNSTDEAGASGAYGTYSMPTAPSLYYPAFGSGSFGFTSNQTAYLLNLEDVHFSDSAAYPSDKMVGYSSLYIEDMNGVISMLRGVKVTVSGTGKKTGDFVSGSGVDAGRSYMFTHIKNNNSVGTILNIMLETSDTWNRTEIVGNMKNRKRAFIDSVARLNPLRLYDFELASGTSLIDLSKAANGTLSGGFSIIRLPMGHVQFDGSSGLVTLPGLASGDLSSGLTIVSLAKSNNANMSENFSSGVCDSPIYFAGNSSVAYTEYVKYGLYAGSSTIQPEAEGLIDSFPLSSKVFASSVGSVSTSEFGMNHFYPGTMMGRVFGSWFVDVVTVSSSKATVYSDFDIAANDAGTSFNSVARSVEYIGHDPVSSRYLNGDVAAIAIFGRVLSKSEIIDIRNGYQYATYPSGLVFRSDDETISDRMGHEVNLVSGVTVDNSDPAGNVMVFTAGTGVNQRIRMSDHADWTMGTGDFCYEAMIYPISFTNGGGYSHIFDSGIDGARANAFSWSMNSTGNLMVWSNGAFLLSTSLIPTLNAWNHVVFQRKSGVASVILNGVQSSTASFGTNLSTSSLSVGAANVNNDPDSSFQFHGKMKDARVWKGLSPY